MQNKLNLTKLLLQSNVLSSSNISRWPVQHVQAHNPAKLLTTDFYYFFYNCQNKGYNYCCHNNSPELLILCNSELLDSVLVSDKPLNSAPGPYSVYTMQSTHRLMPYKPIISEFSGLSNVYPLLSYIELETMIIL